MFTPPKKRPFAPKPNLFVVQMQPSGRFGRIQETEPKGLGWFHFEVSFSVRGGIWKLSCFPNLEPVFLQAAEHGRGVQGFPLSLPCGQPGLDGATVAIPLPFLCRTLPSWG